MSITFEELDRMRAAALDFEPSPKHRAALEQTRPRLVAKLRADPIVQRYMRTHANGAPVRTALDALGEQRTWALLLAGMADEIDCDATLPKMEWPEFALMMAIWIRTAPVFVWRESIRQLALGAGLPRHVISRAALPMPVMWWTFETGIDAQAIRGRPAVIDAILLIDVGEGFRQYGFGSDLDVAPGGLFCGWGQTNYRQTYPDDAPNEGPILSCLSFLNSPYVGRETLTLDRATRRDQQRAGDTENPDVSVLTLRSSNPSPAKGEGEGEGSVEWKHRWMVRGHHRAQWYPSEGAHHVRWIAPYLKGPGDKPLLEKVFSVSR